LPGRRLDERFFMYGEDQVWCEQIRKLGYRIFFFSQTKIIHIHSGSTDHSKQIAMRRTMMQHELEIMKMRKGKGLYYFVYKIIYVTKESTRNFIKWVAYKITGKMVIK
ncbi:MAG TPA: hypothetical protein VLJ68_06820, partial [Chitinophagaceae bacterium]|nr:hypothetical protein [Chitinophagaceae bacterium]